MLLHELLTPSSALCSLEGGSKKRILENIAKVISEQHPDISTSSAFNGLHSREKLGSTGIGDGIAIPHCRLPECTEATAYLIKLDTPIDFDAIDGKAVDLLFILIVPEDSTSEHLATLASVAALFSQEEAREQLRASKSNQELYDTLYKLSTD